jgi:hypothetical protein
MQSAGDRWMPIAAILGVSLIVSGVALPVVVSMLAADDPASEGLHFKGNVDMVLYDSSGQIKDERHIDNLIVDAGIEGIASRIAPHDGTINSSAPYNYIALGTGNVAPNPAHTALEAELPGGGSYGRIQDSSAQYTTSGGNKITLSVTFAPGQATGTLRESGVFNAASGGNMFARQTFADIQKAAGDTLTVTWTITLTPS